MEVKLNWFGRENAKRYNISMRKEDHDLIKEYAERQGLPFSQVLSQICVAYIKQFK